LSFAHWTWLPATIAAVEHAVINNFFWHERITETAWQFQAALEIRDRLSRRFRFNGARAHVDPETLC
jgi:putative flippase GtrA